MMIAGFVVAWRFYIQRPDIPVELARQHDILYRASCCTSGTPDEIYDALIRAPDAVARPRAVEIRRRLADRRLRPGRRSARVIDVTRNVVRLQTGYLYHYAFAMLIGVAGADHLVHVRGLRQRPMSTW